MAGSCAIYGEKIITGKKNKVGYLWVFLRAKSYGRHRTYIVNSSANPTGSQCSRPPRGAQEPPAKVTDCSGDGRGERGSDRLVQPLCFSCGFASQETMFSTRTQQYREEKS